MLAEWLFIVIKLNLKCFINILFKFQISQPPWFHINVRSQILIVFPLLVKNFQNYFKSIFSLLKILIQCQVPPFIFCLLFRFLVLIICPLRSVKFSIWEPIENISHVFTSKLIGKLHFKDRLLGICFWIINRTILF